MALLTVLMKVLEGMPYPVLHDRLLVAILAGVVKGIGGGMVFRSGASLGGTDIIVVALRKRYGVEVGKYTFYINLGVLTLSAFVVGIEGALFGLVSVYANGVVTDNVLSSFDRRRLVFIVSKESAAVTRYITDQMRRGVTVLSGKGGFSGEDRPTLLCLLTPPTDHGTQALPGPERPQGLHGGLRGLGGPGSGLQGMEGDLSDPSFLSQIRTGIHRVLEVREARSATLVLTFLTLASKPVGYLRLLFVASVFGVSMEMDVFHVAFGILWLCVGTAGTALENAVLPLLAHKKVQEGEDAARDVMALAWRILVGYAVLVTAVVLVAPEFLIRLFAAGFDEERLRVGRTMLWWLLPYGTATILKTGYDIWSQFVEQFTLPPLAYAFTGPVLLLSLVLGAFSWGPVAVPFSYSCAWVFVTVLMACALRGFPYRGSRAAFRVLKDILRDTGFCLALIGSGALYGITDRYFASLLATGSIASISYADFLFGLLGGLSAPALFLFLAKSSRLAASAEAQGDSEAFRRKTCQALALLGALFTPLGILLAATSQVWVQILLGYGAFSTTAVHLTSSCLALYALALPCSLGCTTFYRVAQAQRKLPGVVALSLVLVVVNVLGDWILSRTFGVPGIAAATSIVWTVGFLLYGHWLLPGWWRHVGLGALVKQCALATLWAGALGGLDHLALFGRWTPWIVAPLAGIGTILHFLLVERLGWLDALPPGWKPTELLDLIFSRLRRKTAEE